MKLIATFALGLLVAGCDQAYACDYGTAPGDTTGDGVDGTWHIAR